MTAPLVARTALVTGASRGTGRGIAIALARAGAHVVLAARNRLALDAIVAAIEVEGGTATSVVADLSSRAGCDALAAQCGTIDILVNNAAMTVVKMQPTITQDDAYWQDSFQLNLWAPLALMQGLCPGMIERGGGAVINISSVTAQRVVPHYAPYAASKAALETMSRVAALDMAAQRVRVVCVALGMTDTEALAEAAASGGTTAGLMAGQAVPNGQLIDVDEVGRLCAFLAADDARSVTGTVVTIDNAISAGQLHAAVRIDG